MSSWKYLGWRECHYDAAICRRVIISWLSGDAGKIDAVGSLGEMCLVCYVLCVMYYSMYVLCMKGSLVLELRKGSMFILH